MLASVSHDGSAMFQTLQLQAAPLSLAEGGLGIRSGTSGAIPYFSGTGTVASSLLFAANAVVVGGGSGTAPFTITADTGTTHFLAATATSPAFRQILTSDLTGTLAAGQSTWVQYNQSGNFAADSGLTYDAVANWLVFGGNVIAGHQSGANNRLLVSTPGSNALISVLNVNNQSTGSGAGTGMLFTAGADTANIGGVTSVRTDASSNSITSLRVLSNSSLTSGGSSDPLYVSGAAGGTTVNMKGTLANVIGSGTGILRTTSGTVANISDDAAAGHVLFSRGSSPAFSQALTTDISGVYSETAGGTGLNTYAKGDIIGGTGTNTVGKLPVGVMGQILSVDSGATTGFKWVAAPAAGTPGGSTTQFQYNNASVFAGTAGITTDGIRFSQGPGTSVTVSHDVAGNLRTVPFALTDGASIAIDLSRSNYFIVTLGGNRTLANPTNFNQGQTFTVVVSQDGTGSRKMGFGTSYRFGTDVVSYDASTTATTNDYIKFRVRNAQSVDIVGVAKGYR